MGKSNKQKQLEEIVKKSLRKGEKFEKSIAGKTLLKSDFGREIVHGLFAMTNQRVFVLKKPVLGKNKLDAFCYNQINFASSDDKVGSMSLTTQEEVITLCKVKDDEGKEAFEKDFKKKKTPKKTTFTLDSKGNINPFPPD